MVDYTPPCNNQIECCIAVSIFVLTLPVEDEQVDNDMYSGRPLDLLNKLGLPEQAQNALIWSSIILHI